ncbi:winged helix-turn-helix domain-containing protein [Ruegeria sp. 2205SS24-7]|uniref:winged helix-turn-helix domain-containing protein n=1 Tax=Ruegeria discodermiae TaxID=3064389 RepID=UPI00274230C8|nr:winged helix-turn-helix domain-containing protein [Ruegeria sp. 2205SS24-7]MDP5219938.1 winged helix-turn-helix domain-containing protein [Ruegeria sp. 2205SS24-7]
MYRFGDFELDSERFELRRAGQVVKIEPRSLELLFLLIENPDRVISRDEIIDKLWEGRIVTDSAVSTCLKGVRRAVGDDGKTQAVIKTVHGRGFRFVGDLETVSVNQAALTDTVSDQPSLIILPMQVFGVSPDLQGVADGFVETLTTVLTRVPLLSIVSRAASFALKDRAIDVSEVRNKFGAWYMLEGSLQRSAGKVRANFQLINSASGHHIWARRVELPDGEGLTDELLTTVLPLLEPQLVRAMMKDLDRTPGEQFAPSLTLEATGVLSLKGWNRASFEEATDLLVLAIEQQPDLALAHAHLALVLGLGHRVGILGTRDTLLPRVVAAADRAMDLDGMDSTILGLSGCALADIGERERAIPILEAALEMNPDNAQARTALGTIQLIAGRFKEGAYELRSGIQSSPMDPRRAVWGTALAMATLLSGKTPQAVEEIERACRADPRNHIPLVALAAIEVWQNRKEAAEQALMEAFKIRPDLSDREIKALVGKGFYASLEPMLETARQGA